MTLRHLIACTAVVAAGTAIATAPAYAQSSETASPPPPTFRNLDADDNRRLTLPEAGADTRISDDFRQADKDGDFRLSRQEFEAALRMQGRRGERGEQRSERLPRSGGSAATGSGGR